MIFLKQVLFCNKFNKHYPCFKQKLQTLCFFHSDVNSGEFAERFGMFVNVNRGPVGIIVELFWYFAEERSCSSRPALCQVALCIVNQYSGRSCAVLSEVAPPVRLLLSVSLALVSGGDGSINTPSTLCSLSDAVARNQRSIQGRVD